MSDTGLATSAVKKAFLADKITLNIAGLEGLEDDFSEYDTIGNREVHHRLGNDFIRSWVVRVPKYIRGLFGENFCFIQHDEVEKIKLEKIRLNLLTDDRMFFQCWYGSDEVAKKLAIKTKGVSYFQRHFLSKEPEIIYPYLSDNFWHSFMFGDKDEPTIANMELQISLTKKHSYTRWAGKGTLYGFTKDSFVCITDKSWFSVNLVSRQMKTMYYQMAVLGLAQRVSVLRFSAEVSSLADTTKASENSRLVENIKILYRNYIEFINKINYKEVTPYIQGIEMYCHFREVLQVQENVSNLDGELNELFNYVKLQEDEHRNRQAHHLNIEAKKQSDEAHKLTIIASIFLPSTFLATVFALFSSELRVGGKLDWARIGAVLIILIVIFVAFRFHRKINSWLNDFFYKKEKKQ